MPAAVTATSTAPRVSCVSPTQARTESAEATSTLRDSTRTPNSSSSFSRDIAASLLDW